MAALAADLRDEVGAPSVLLVDQESPFYMDGGMTVDPALMKDDGIHPTPAGDEQIADTWYGPLVPFLECSNP